MIGHPDLDVWWAVGGAMPAGPAGWARHAGRWEACGGADHGAVELLEIGRRG